jgi:hypothetical protein
MVAQYFAQLDNNNVVTSVHVVTAEYMAENPERYLGVWVETFFDIEGKTFAGIGDTYNYETQNFVPIPQPDPVQPLEP